MKILDYRSFKRQMLKDIDKVSNKKVSNDITFENNCEYYLDDKISLKEFDNYLDKSLGLLLTESQLQNFDDAGNLINLQLLNETWFGDFLDGVTDKVKSTFNISVSFFEKVASKIKSFISNISARIVSGADKIGDMVISIIGKVMSGLKMFKNFLNKHTKKIVSAIYKLIIGFGITFSVSSIVSYFGTGWVAVSGSKVLASEVDKKFDVSGKISKAITGEKAAEVSDFNKFKKEEDEKNGITPKEEVKNEKPGFFAKMGAKLLKVYEFFAKFKIVGLIFLGTIWIIGSIFYPLHQALEPIYKATKMNNFFDIFKKDFVSNLSTTADIKVENVPKVEVKKYSIPNMEDESNLGINDVNTVSSNQINSMAQTCSKATGENPKDFIAEMSNILNDLKEKSAGESGISKIDVDIAEELSEEGLEKTADGNVDILAKTDVEGVEFLDNK